MTADLTVVRPVEKQIARIEDLQRALDMAVEPQEIRELEAKLDALEQYMRQSGLYSTEEIRPVNETKMWARWKLGQALAKVERGHGPGRGKKNQVEPDSFKALLKRIGLGWDVAQEAQRIATLPKPELERALDWARKVDDLCTYEELVTAARPYWYQASRKQKHRRIAASASVVAADDWGPFPLIYADPPWKFQVYSEKGLDRTPDQHYPTLTDEEIAKFRIGGKTIDQIAHRDAALLLWCTSSNIVRAIDILWVWGFEYKFQAIWVKTNNEGRPISGMGLVFRNMHEVLLYGTKGQMPGPQYQPPSVFFYPRGEHSAKPPEIRTEIEKMYPDFDARTRLELFTRETVDGWTPYGYETHRKVA